MSKIATLSFAVLMLGSSAALAQPYGYYGYGNACGRNLANVVNLIIDPATGRRITQAEYEARYPWTNPSTWTYDCATNLWTDHTAEQNPGNYAQDYGYRGRGHWHHDRRD